jgi:glycerol dehydrogenase
MLAHALRMQRTVLPSLSRQLRKYSHGQLGDKIDFGPEVTHEKVFISPARYVQGRRVIPNAAKFVNKVGKMPLVISDDFVMKLAGHELISGLRQDTQIKSVHATRFGGEASEQEIARLSKHADSIDGLDMIIGIGGGKTMDAAKHVANDLGVRCVIVPTTASTDAPTSAVSVLYTPEGIFERYCFWDRNPDLVLVDTALLVRAPPRFLASGIADAAATFIESAPAIQAGSTNMAGGKTTILGYKIGETCQETLFKYAELGMEANRQQVVTPAFEAIVEANTLLSGLGFESGGLGAAHSVHNGFTALSGKIHSLLHGEKVAFGCLCQLVLDGKTQTDFGRFAEFFMRVGLPVTLAELHLGDVTDDQLMAVARRALVEGESAHNLPYALSPRMVYESIKAADAYAKIARDSIGWKGRFAF